MHKDDVYYKEGAVVVPDVRAIKVRILKDLHDSAYAGHVEGFRPVKKDICPASVLVASHAR